VAACAGSFIRVPLSARYEGRDERTDNFGRYRGYCTLHLPDRGSAASGGFLMTTQAWLLLAFFTVALVALAWPLARMIDAVMNGRFSLGRYAETSFFRLAGIKPEIESGWPKEDCQKKGGYQTQAFQCRHKHLLFARLNYF